MDTLPESCAPLIDALIRSSRAWQTPREVASATGLEVEQTTDLLADLDLAGWLDVWECDPRQGPVVTLTAAAAEIMGVRLVEVGFDEVPRWIRQGDPEPSPPRARGVFVSHRAAQLDQLFDQAPTPDEAAELAEEATRQAAHAVTLAPSAAAKNLDRLPHPTLLIGEGLSPFPGPMPTPPPVCPACAGRELDPHEYCLVCDSWGLDALLRAAPTTHRLLRAAGAPPRNDAPRPRDRKPEVQAARARRKARQKAKLLARLDSERAQARPKASTASVAQVRLDPRHAPAQPHAAHRSADPSRFQVRSQKPASASAAR
ncbi:hypothetical protein EP7_005049 [Isosphaeraceae bacterium EP7]